jgi:predicted hydrolase (HD superfamily)
MDYEAAPTKEEHPFGKEASARARWPESVLHAILAHADYSGVARSRTWTKRCLRAMSWRIFDGLCVVKPSKSIHEVEVAGVKKKMKDKAFARAVDEEDITGGA